MYSFYWCLLVNVPTSMHLVPTPTAMPLTINTPGLVVQSKEEAAAGAPDLRAAAQGLRLPSPNSALAPPPGGPSAFQVPKNEDWRSKFRSSDSFTSEKGTPVSCLATPPPPLPLALAYLLR